VETALQIANWWKLGSIAVITPVTPRRSKFVRQLVERVSNKPLAKKGQIGPFKLFWEAGQDDHVERTCREAGTPDDGDGSFGALAPAPPPRESTLRPTRLLPSARGRRRSEPLPALRASRPLRHHRSLTGAVRFAGRAQPGRSAATVGQ